MNTDSFVKYLKDSTFLHQISYQELKTLALQYPYCQNLHLLLLKKSYLDNNEEWENNLERAATYSFDRTQLFYQMQSLEQDLAPEDTFLLSEEYLELKDLSETAAEKPPSLIQEEGGFSASQEKMIDPEPVLDNDTFVQDQGKEEKGLNLELPEAIKDEPSPILPTASGPSARAKERFHVPDGLIQEIIAISQLWPATQEARIDMPANPSASIQFSLLSKLQQRDARQLRKAHKRPQSRPSAAASTPPEIKPKPRPKRSFNSWLRQFQEPDVKGQLEDIMEYKKLEEVKKKKKKKKKQYQMPPIAVKSITENEEVASETLADILVEQGRYEKAIQMYNRLVLLFPEKSSYFAAKINNLKSA